MSQVVEPTTPSLRAVRLPAPIVWSLLALLFFVLFLRPVPQGDIWFILLMGKKTLDSMAVPHHEFFLYTADGAPDLFGAWGFGVLMELARRIAGLPGIIALNAALWSAALCISLMAVRVRIGRTIGSVFSWTEIASFMLGLSLLFEGIVQRSMLRPEITMFMAWSLGCLLFEQAKRTGKWHRPLIIYPLLIWLEAWLHTAGPVLLLPLGGYAIEYFWTSIRARTIQSTKDAIILMLPWTFAILAAIILPVLNPNGVTQVYAHVHMLIDGVNGQTAQFNPGMPIADKHFFNLEYFAAWEWPPFYRVYTLIFIVIGLSLLYEAKLLLNCATLLPLAIFALLHVRGLGLLAWAALIPVSATINGLGMLIGRASALSSLSGGRWQRIIVMGCAAFILMTTIKYDLFIKFPLTVPLAAGMHEINRTYPEGGNIFTDHHLGALTAWSLGDHYKVPISAHIMVVHTELSRHFMHVSHVEDGWEDDLLRYHVIAIVTRTNNLGDAMINGLPLRLLFNTQWRLADVQDEAATFIRLRTDEPQLEAAQRLTQMKRYWKQVHKIAMQTYEDMPLARTKAAIEMSNRMLNLIAADNAPPGATIAAMQQEAEKSPSWTMQMLKDK